MSQYFTGYIKAIYAKSVEKISFHKKLDKSCFLLISVKKTFAMIYNEQGGSVL